MPSKGRMAEDTLQLLEVCGSRSGTATTFSSQKLLARDELPLSCSCCFVCAGVPTKSLQAKPSSVRGNNFTGQLPRCCGPAVSWFCVCNSKAQTAATEAYCHWGTVGSGGVGKLCHCASVAASQDQSRPLLLYSLSAQMPMMKLLPSWFGNSKNSSSCFAWLSRATPIWCGKSGHHLMSRPADAGPGGVVPARLRRRAQARDRRLRPWDRGRRHVRRARGRLDSAELVVLHDALDFGRCHLALAVPMSGKFAEVDSLEALRAMSEWTETNPLRVVTGELGVLMWWCGADGLRAGYHSSACQFLNAPRLKTQCCTTAVRYGTRAHTLSICIASSLRILHTTCLTQSVLVRAENSQGVNTVRFTTTSARCFFAQHCFEHVSVPAVFLYVRQAALPCHSPVCRVPQHRAPLLRPARL